MFKPTKPVYYMGFEGRQSTRYEDRDIVLTDYAIIMGAFNKRLKVWSLDSQGNRVIIRGVKNDSNSSKNKVRLSSL
jgi:hypothetical protein